ncbi:MAG: PAS domain S-box protein [Fibrobacter sp.]|nr:PAS domain S-box protein [Fibrobacter sp.]
MDFKNIPSEEFPAEFSGLLDWFNETVGRLEAAYSELGEQFQTVNRELAQTNQSLEYNQRRLNALLGSMGPGVIMVDSDMKFTVINRSAEKLLGVTEKDCLGKPVREVFAEESGVGTVMLRALAEKKDLSQEITLHISDKNFPVSVSGSRVIDSEANVLGAMETIADLSELRKMQAEVQQSRILTALGEMAATVAHEIRNPLGGIGGYAGLLARGIPPEDPKRKLVDQIIQGVSSLNNIVTNLLSYTRKTTLQMVRLDLCEWIESVIAHAEIEVEKEKKPIEIQRDFSQESVFVEIDPERFQQVVLNLLFNAIQSIGDKGWVKVGITVSQAKVWLKISDNGKGMPPEAQKDAFTPFFTTKEQGTGLGLAIVKKLVDLHAGTIEVQSEVGAGTEFLICLKET